VVLEDGRGVIVGQYRAHYPAPAMVEIYDPLTEQWALGSSPTTLRSHPKVVLLPNGDILTAGGFKEIADQPGTTNEWGYVALVDLYDPATDRWKPLAPMRVPREYHAMMLLAPDGRVIVTAGTGAPGANDGTGTDNGVDAYEPPCLFRGPRPVLTHLSQTDLRYGQPFTIEFANTAAPTAVVLIGLHAMTHYVDGGPGRTARLPFHQVDRQLQVLLPEDPVRVPAGHYMLFLMVDDIPSEARIVRVAPHARRQGVRCSLTGDGQTH
jgi:galactose oxidase